MILMIRENPLGELLSHKVASDKESVFASFRTESKGVGAGAGALL